MAGTGVGYTGPGITLEIVALIGGLSRETNAYSVPDDVTAAARRMATRT